MQIFLYYLAIMVIMFIMVIMVDIYKFDYFINQLLLFIYILNLFIFYLWANTEDNSYGLTDCFV